MWQFVVLLYVTSTVYGLSHWTSWSKMGACSVTCGAGVIWQQRTCVGDNPHPVCRGAQQRSARCQKLACPVNDCNCGCMLTEERGNIRSVSPSSNSLHCTWSIKTKTGTQIKLTVTNFVLKYGNLRVVDPRTVYRTLTKRRSGSNAFPFTVLSHSNQLNLTLLYHKGFESEDGVKLEAAYETLAVTSRGNKPEEKATLNIPTVAGIAACVFIIILATCFIVYRKMNSQGKGNGGNQREDEADDNCATSSSTSLRHGVDNEKQNLAIDKNNKSNYDCDQQRLLLNQNNVINVRMNPPGVPMYTNAQRVDGRMGFNPQYHQAHVLIQPNDINNFNIVKQQQLVGVTPRENHMSGVYA